MRNTLTRTRRASVRTSKAVIALEAVLYIMIPSSVETVLPHMRRDYKITLVNFPGTTDISRGSSRLMP